MNQSLCDDVLMLEDVVDQRMTANECHINKLNDYCLLEIFSYLGLFETLDLEKVCERWKNIINYEWSLKKKLNIDILLGKPGYDDDSYKLSIEIFRKLLIKCGPNLNVIILTADIYSPSFNKVHTIIAECCPKIEVLNISRLKTIDNGTIEGLARTCKHLKEIHFTPNQDIKEKALKKLFSKNKYLESVNLYSDTYSNKGLSGTFLRRLTPQLKQLRLGNCESLRPAHLLYGINIFKSLEVLSLRSYIYIASAPVLEEIVDKLPNLTSLSLDYEDYDVVIIPLAPIRNIKNLKHLSLVLNAAVNDSFLELISQSCQYLVSLNIDRTKVTAKGVAHLAGFPKLTDVSLEDISAVCDASLKPLASKGLLQRLNVRGCKNFDDKAALMLMQHCKDLTYWNMDYCRNVTRKTFLNAVNILNRFPNRQLKLTFDPEDYLFDLGHTVYHPLLEITSKNFPGYSKV